MIYKIYPLSDKVELYEELDSTETTVPSLLPFLRERMAFLESIRKQSFRCRVLFLPTSKDNNYRFLEEIGEGLITIQYPVHIDFRYMPRLLFHELCHYTMDNRNAPRIPGSRRMLSTYEEIIADVFSLQGIKALRLWLHHLSDTESERQLSRYIEELSDEVRPQTDRLARQSIREVPLYDSSLLPEYYNIQAIAFRLLPHFESHPELWRILPHVQDVHPLSPWNDFFGYLIKTADNSCRNALIELYKDLFA